MPKRRVELVVAALTFVRAYPVGVPYAEVYTALQTNVIDAAESNISSIGADNLCENAKHVTLTGHYFWPGLFFMSKAKYDTLSPELQQAIVETCRNLTPEFVAHTKQQEAEGIERLEAEGVQIYPFEDRERLLELMQPVFDEWAAKDPLIGESIEATKKPPPVTCVATRVWTAKVLCSRARVRWRRSGVALPRGKCALSMRGRHAQD